MVHKISQLLLLSKNDIPFVEAEVVIHQPTLKEIALIGESAFFLGCQLLNFSRGLLNLSEEEMEQVKDVSDFELFLSFMTNGEKTEYKNYIYMVLTLLFPAYQISLEKDNIQLTNIKTQEIKSIDKKNFSAFKEILVLMFEIDTKETQNYNPIGKKANKIAEKLRKAKQKTGDEEKQEINVFSRYVSILAVGLKKDMNSLMEYTVFQIKDEFKRFQLKSSFDMYVQAKMAGAKDMDEADNWMDNIHLL